MRPRILWLAAVGGAVLIGYVVSQCFRPIPPDPARREAETEANKAADEQPRRSAPATFIFRTDLKPSEPLFETATNPWRTQLSALINGREELFGPQGEQRLKDLRDYVESIALGDLPAILKELHALQTEAPTAFGKELQLHLVQRWAESDIHSAADWVSQMPPGSEREHVVAALAAEWARQSLTDATVWAKQLPDDAERQMALGSAANETVYANPVEVLTLAATLTPSPTLDEIIARALGAWTRNAPNDAVAWAKNIPDEGLRERTIASVATTWGERDPTGAAYLTLGSLRPGPVQDSAIIAIVQRWVQTDASGATAWVNQFPEGTLRRTAMAMLDKYSSR